MILDPFQGCKILDAPDLRQILKNIAGPQAELSSSYYDVVSRRDILIRLQNNIKLRQIEAEDFDAALRTIAIMRVIKPDEYRLLLDEGVLRARIGA